MIIVDNALKARAAAGKPIQVGLIGAGFMGRGIANQILNSVPGMRLAAIANRTVSQATRAYEEAGALSPVCISTANELDDAIGRGTYAVTDDPTLICQAQQIDAVIDVTGAVEFGAQVAWQAIGHGKHIILMNAELDGTVGAILKVYADKAGVIISGSDGDQPGVQMNLYRFVKSLGLTPLLCGNIKGLHDPYRNPTTQKGFAEKWGQQPTMVTSFADGTKISFEQAIVANATGMQVAQRGMLGYHFDGHVDELTKRYDVDELKRLNGIVDYVVGARPGPGVFLLATHEDPKQRHYLNLYKLGEGPLYSFYMPYHLCHFEAPLSVARAVLFGDAALAPLGAPRVEVIAAAKTDLNRGQILDGLGGYTTYGLCENAPVVRREDLLPIGLAEGGRLARDVAKDEVLTRDDVILPAGRLCDRLREEQDRFFGTAPAVSTAIETNPALVG
jgi:predicted homoserine dehydrogenase-like protein